MANFQHGRIAAQIIREVKAECIGREGVCAFEVLSSAGAPCRAWATTKSSAFENVGLSCSFPVA